MPILLSILLGAGVGIGVTAITGYDLNSWQWWAIAVPGCFVAGSLPHLLWS